VTRGQLPQSQRRQSRTAVGLPPRYPLCSLKQSITSHARQ